MARVIASETVSGCAVAVFENTLTDGSKVFDVLCEVYRIACTDEAHAIKLYQVLTEAFEIVNISRPVWVREGM